MLIFHRDVLDFHRAMNLTIGNFSAPKIPDSATAELRCRLIEEEIWETVEKGLKSGVNAEGAARLTAWEQVIDGLCDSTYVSVGAAITFGIDLTEFLCSPSFGPFSGDRKPFDCWEEKARLLLGAKRVACEAITGGIRGNVGDIDEVAPALSGLTASIGHVAAFYGIDLHIFWPEVQRANMAKKNGPIREDGKKLKPIGWKGPDHLPMILKIWPDLAV